VRFHSSTPAVEVALPQPGAEEWRRPRPGGPRLVRALSLGSGRSPIASGEAAAFELPAETEEGRREVCEIPCLRLIGRPVAAGSASALSAGGRLGREAAGGCQLFLARPDSPTCPSDTLCMQLRHADKDSFELQVGPPLSPVQAFAVALSFFDHSCA